MNHIESWITVGLDIYWFVRWPLMCFLWMALGQSDPEKKEGWHIALFFAAVIWTLIATNVSV